MALLPAVEFEIGEKPDCCVIWLHGLGADGNDFAPIVPDLGLPEDLSVRFIFPHAPRIPVTINGRLVMPAWYDILEMNIDRRVDMEGLMTSARAVSLFIDRELDRGISSRRIVIAGFSQGGAVAYQVALSCKVRLCGLLAMSSYFATSEEIEFEPVNRDLPIEIMHGMYDPVVPEKLGRKALEFLEEHGYSPNYRTYPMEHNVCMVQIQDIGFWLKKILG